MNFQQGDIIVRTSANGDTIWLSERLVADVCDITDEYFKITRHRFKSSVLPCHRHHNILPITGKSWRWAKINGGFYYDLAAIPNRKPTYYRDMFGDAAKLVDDYESQLLKQKTNDLETKFKQYLKQNYKDYLPEYRSEKPTHCTALAKACATLEFILLQEPNYPGTVNAIYNDISPILKNLDLRYVPHHPLKIKEKIEQLKQTDDAITDLIYLPRKGNKNAEQYNDPEVWSWVMQMRAMPQNYSNAHIIREVVYGMCERTGKKKPSKRWFGLNIFEDKEMQFLTSTKRYGSLNRGQMHRAYFPYHNAIHAGDCWEVDASRVNFIAHEYTYVDDKGKTQRAQRHLMCIAVRDVHSGDVLGYSFAHSEDHISYQAAIKMAIERTGYLPYELVVDRFPGHNTEMFTKIFERMTHAGVKVTIAHDANAKAGLERWFSTMQQVVYQGNDYFYGEGIQSRNIAARRTPEYLSSQRIAKKDGWDVQAAIEQAEYCIEQWRKLPYSTYSRKFKKVNQSPEQLHNQSLKPNVVWLEKHEIEMIIGIQKTLKLQRNGLIRTEIKGVQFHYHMTPDQYPILKKNHGKNVVLALDYEDLSHVYMYRPHGNLLQYLCEVPLQESGQKYGPDADMSAFGVFKATQDYFNEQKEADLAEIIAPGEDSLMLGKFGKKSEVNHAEDAYLEQALNQKSYKKVSGSDVEPDDTDENSILNNHRKTY